MQLSMIVLDKYTILISAIWFCSRKKKKNYIKIKTLCPSMHSCMDKIARSSETPFKVDRTNINVANMINILNDNLM